MITEGFIDALEQRGIGEASMTDSRAWEEHEHPRGPGGKFASLLDEMDDIDEAVGLPKPTKGPIKLNTKGKGKIKPASPVVSVEDEIDLDAPPDDFDLGAVPPPIFSPVGDVNDAPTDLGPAPDLGPPPVTPEPANSPRREYGRKTTERISNEPGGKDHTDLPEDWERDRLDKLEGNYNWWENLDPEQQKAVRDLVADTSAKPTYVRMFPGGLNGMARDGRMKTVHDTRDKGDEYQKQRGDYEREVVGLDDNTPAEHMPVYGYVGDAGTADVYGPVAVKLRPETRDRTTATVGDSLNGLSQPYAVDKLPDLTDDQLLANIYGGTNVQNYLARGSIWDYLEAQVHGGVTLDDIESVHIELDHDETLDGVASPETLATLRRHGIKVVVKNQELLPGLTPEQIANLKGMS